MNEDALLECDSSWGQITNGVQRTISKGKKFQVLIKASQDLPSTCDHIHTLNHEMFFLWNSGLAHSKLLLTGNLKAKGTHFTLRETDRIISDNRFQGSPTESTHAVLSSWSERN